MNPWLQHPALRGVQVPSRYLPPGRSWPVAVAMGIVVDDGLQAGARRVAANPRYVGWKRTEGPVPDLDMPLPDDATSVIYDWLVKQAAVRLEAVKSHLRTRQPTASAMAREFGVRLDSVQRWIDVGREAGAGAIEAPPVRAFSANSIRVPRGALYFASGAQGSPGEIEGLARLADSGPGIGVGIQVQSCGDQCRLALKREHTNAPKVPLFVDSGAFSEFTESVPITDPKWKEILRAYKDLSKLYGKRGFFVAPDKIGSQAETLRRLKKHEKAIAEVSKRSYVIVAAQAGSKPRHVFWNEAAALLVRAGAKKDRVVAGLPMVRRATSPVELEAFAAESRVNEYSGVLHLLGMGPASKLFPKLYALIEGTLQRRKLKLTMDSVLIRGGSGRGWLSVEPTTLTYAQDIVRYAVMWEAYWHSVEGAGFMENWIKHHGWDMDAVPERDENLYEIDSWLTGSEFKLLEDLLQEQARAYHSRSLTKKEKRLLKEDPSRLFSSDAASGLTAEECEARGCERVAWWEFPEVEAWLDDRWCRFLGAYFSATVKRDAIVKAYRLGGAQALVDKLKDTIPYGELQVVVIRLTDDLLVAVRRN